MIITKYSYIYIVYLFNLIYHIIHKELFAHKRNPNTNLKDAPLMVGVYFICQSSKAVTSYNEQGCIVNMLLLFMFQKINKRHVFIPSTAINMIHGTLNRRPILYLNENERLN